MIQDENTILKLRGRNILADDEEEEKSLCLPTLQKSQVQKIGDFLRMKFILQNLKLDYVTDLVNYLIS